MTTFGILIVVLIMLIGGYAVGKGIEVLAKSLYKKYHSQRGIEPLVLNPSVTIKTSEDVVTDK